MPKKDSSWIQNSGLYGTWTFTTETMTDVGYYKGIAYVVMHIMPDPMQVKSCVIKGTSKDKNNSCIEANNKACSHVGAVDNEHEECVNTENSEVEWSDVTAFFQFGFRLRTGIVRKSYHEVYTSDWLGPYNMILAPIEKHHHQDGNERVDEGKLIGDGNHTKPHTHDKKDLYVSRYVNTPWTATELQRPFASSAIFNFDSTILEEVVGTIAINSTIYAQKEWRGTPKSSRGAILAATAKIAPLREGLKKEATDGGDVSFTDGASVSSNNDDPYARYSKTCAHGDLRPILPKLEIERTTHIATENGIPPPKTTYSLKVDYPMLSLPEKRIDDLYKLWPTIKSHLGPKFPLQGPYCYGKDPNRAYAIHLSYDSAARAEAATWKGVKGCVAPWPCWRGDPQPPAPPPSAMIPEDNHSEGSYVLDPMGLEAVIVYAMGFLLLVSLVFNCQLANRLKKLQDSGDRGGIDHGRRNGPIEGAQEAPTSATRGAPRNNSGVSPSYYLREAAGGQSNSLEEPLLTASDDGANRRHAESAEGVEESKQEVE